MDFAEMTKNGLPEYGSPEFLELEKKFKELPQEEQEKVKKQGEEMHKFASEALPYFMMARANPTLQNIMMTGELARKFSEKFGVGPFDLVPYVQHMEKQFHKQLTGYSGKPKQSKSEFKPKQNHNPDVSLKGSLGDALKAALEKGKKK